MELLTLFQAMALAQVFALAPTARDGSSLAQNEMLVLALDFDNGSLFLLLDYLKELRLCDERMSCLCIRMIGITTGHRRASSLVA